MVLLPDYPEKTFLAHRLRVERLALLCTLVLIGGGGWWLLPAVTGGAEMFPRVGPVLVLFASALLLPDLIDYGPVERTRLGAAANIAWPSILVLAGIHYGQGDELIASLMLAARVDRIVDAGSDSRLPLALHQSSTRWQPWNSQMERSDKHCWTRHRHLHTGLDERRCGSVGSRHHGIVGDNGP